MQIVIKSSRAAVCVDWSDYALLRDNIQHYLESGTPTDHFAAIHAIEQAVDRGQVDVEAARLRGELLGACYALRRLHLEDCAVSVRTRARVTHCATPGRMRGTTRSRSSGWALPVEQRTGRLMRHLQPFVRAILYATETAVDGDRLDIRAVPAPRPTPQG